MITKLNDYKLLLEYNELPSSLQIDDEVAFVPMFWQQEEMGITDDKRYGKIVNVKFTRSKVFYDVLDDYYGKIFTEIDSAKVWRPAKPTLPLEEEPEGSAEIDDIASEVQQQLQQQLGENNTSIDDMDAKILNFLLNQESASTLIEIVKNVTDLDEQTITDRLAELQKDGFVQYDAIDNDYMPTKWAFDCMKAFTVKKKSFGDKVKSFFTGEGMITTISEFKRK